MNHMVSVCDQRGQKPNTLTPRFGAPPCRDASLGTYGTFIHNEQDSQRPVSRTWALVMVALSGVGKMISSEKQETRLHEVH